MIERFTQGNLVWVNLKRPTTEEVQQIMKEHKLPPALLGDLTSPVPRSTAVSLDGVVKLTIDFPTIKWAHNIPHEIKFIISKKALITVHYEEMEAIDRFKKEFEVISTLHKASKKAHVGHIFVSLLSELYRVMDSKLDYIESKLGDIESGMFDGEEKQVVYTISDVSKKIISFRQTIKTHDELLREAKPHLDSIFKNNLNGEFQEMTVRYFHVLRRTSALFETLADLRETNMALLTTKQNEVMKILTIMAFITFPLSLLTSMFGMNTESTPLIGRNGDFWIILGIMSVATVCFFTFFKYKNWI